MNWVRRPDGIFWTLVLAPVLACGGVLAMGGISVVAERRIVEAEDSYPLLTYRLTEKRRSRRQSLPHRGLIFYLQGSSCASAMYAAEFLAGATAAGIPAVITEKRGIDEDGEADQSVCHEFSSKTQRVTDQLRVLSHYLEEADDGSPIILLGTSEGGDVAAAVAAREPRVTHLVLLATGGGWSQEQELRFLLRQQPGYLDLSGEEELDEVLEKVRAAPRSLELWAGLPYRRWSSYLWDPPLKDLLTLEVPVFLGHGTSDRSVPVESARAVREAFQDAGKTNLTYREYAETDHSFQATSSGSKSSGSNRLPWIELDLIRWFADHGVLSPEHAQKLMRRVRRNHPELPDERARGGP